MIALKAEVRDLLQKFESKERRTREVEGKSPEKYNDEGIEGDGDGSRSDYDQEEDKLYSLVRRLDEQVRID